MNFVLGSGLIGRLAAHLLDWPLIAFGCSRFYSHVPALADDYIVFAEDVSKAIGFGPSGTFHVTKASLGGQLLPLNAELCGIWCQRLYGELHPIQVQRAAVAPTLAVSATRLHHLMDSRGPKKLTPPAIHIVDRISERTIYLGSGETLSYDRLISTIPLDALCRLTDQAMDLPSLDVCFTHVQTDALDFEGADEVLVLDEHFDFFKVQHVGGPDYVFWSREELAEEVLAACVPRHRILQRTKVPQALPTGLPPKLQQFEALGIRCIGSCAQWDDAMDVSSCIRRILRT